MQELPGLFYECRMVIVGPTQMTDMFFFTLNFYLKY